MEEPTWGSDGGGYRRVRSGIDRLHVSGDLIQLVGGAHCTACFYSSPWQRQATLLLSVSAKPCPMNEIHWTCNKAVQTIPRSPLGFPGTITVRLPQQRMEDLDSSLRLSVCSSGTPSFSFSATCLPCLGLTGSWGGFPGRKYAL